MNTVGWTLGAAGLVSWLLTTWARRWVDRREKVAACAHSLWLDEADGWNATLRCNLCTYQEPARAYIKERQEQREAAIQRRMERCPRCRGELDAE